MAEKDKFQVPPFRRMFLFASPIFFAVAIYYGSQWAIPKLGSGVATPYGANLTLLNTPDASPPDGAKLFVLHCSNCHGVRGDGKGVASLAIKARYFGHEKFKFANSKNGIPTDDDLHALLQRGIPGSAMPDFKQLTVAERDAIIGHVRTLTWSGTYDRLMKKAIKDYDDGGDDPSPGKVAKLTDAECTIGDPLEIPDFVNNPRPESLANGKTKFQAICAACHGANGLGDGEQVKDPKYNAARADGTFVAPRNFTLGLYKGGGENRHLYARVFLGIKGPLEMPASGGGQTNPPITPQDISDLVFYVKSLAKPEP